MITIKLTEEQQREVFKQVLNEMQNGLNGARVTHVRVKTRTKRGATPAARRDNFKTALEDISKGETFSSADLAKRCGVTPRSIGMQLRALARKKLVTKLGGGEWKHV